MDGLSEEEFYKKKQALMRKLTAKNTKFLYEKETKKKGESLREMAAKKEQEEKIQRATLRQTSTVSNNESEGSHRSCSRLQSSTNVLRK